MDSNGTRQVLDAVPDYEYIAPIGYSNSSRCGYCGSQGKSYSYYASASSISPKFYQTLLDRCWRRSGKLLYRPDQRRSCCPHYTIRLDSSEFKSSKAQRQTANRFNKFVLGEDYVKEAARLYPRTKEETKRRDNDYVLIERIHEAEIERLATPPEPAQRFSVTLEDDAFTEEKYQVYDNYQRKVHHDPPGSRTRMSFTRFLCSSPLRRQTIVGPDGKKRKLGSFHQCYRLDGKLVAIGVLDLLPDCVSSVYFLYDESIHRHMPGKLGALHEIALAYEGGYRWWYPGFYIHSCPKMRYKIDYAPQYILDPETLHWDLLDQTTLTLLDKKRFVSLYLERNMELANVNTEEPHKKAVKTIGTEDAASRANRSDDEGQVASVGKEQQAHDDVDENDNSNNKDSKYEDDADNGDEDEDDDDGDLSLFHSTMPGIPSITHMKDVNMDNIALKGMRTGPLYETSDLIGWNSSTIDQWPGIKAGVAELVAALGTDCVGVLCLDLTPGGD